MLKDGFEFKEGAEVKVQSVLAYVGVDDESQKLVTRSLKKRSEISDSELDILR